MFLLRFRYPSLANETFAQRRLRLSELYCYSRSGKKTHFLFCCCRTKELLPCVSCIVLSFWKFSLFSLVCVFKCILDSLLPARLLIVDTFSKTTSGLTAEFTTQSQTPASRLKTLSSTTDSLHGRKGSYEEFWPKPPRRTR